MADGQFDRRSLYDVAYAFKKTGLWKRLSEDELFAVRLDGGRIGYCSVEGIASEFVALKLFVGAEGFASLCESWSRMEDDDPFSVLPDLRQDCIACGLEAKEMLSKAEQDEVRAYCRAHGVTFRAPHPKFERFRPNCIPWNVTDEQELRDLHAALTAAVWLSGELDVHGLPGVGLHHVLPDVGGDVPDMRLSDRPIPLLIHDGDGMRVEPIPLPEKAQKQLLRPGPVSDIALAKLKKLPRRGRIECEVIRGPVPVQDDPEEVPFLPAMLVAVETEQEWMLPAAIGREAVYDPSQMLGDFVEGLISSRLYPREIVVRGEETILLMRDFCDRAKITMTMMDSMPALDDALDGLAEAYGLLDPDEEEDFDELFNDLSAMSDRDMGKLRGDFATFLLELAESGRMPRLLADRIRQHVKP